MKATRKNKEINKSVLNFNAVFIEEIDGGYSVSVPSLPGCFSQGDNFEEAVKNIKEAISLYLEEEPESLKHSHGKEVVIVPNHKTLRPGTLANILGKLNLDAEKLKEMI